MIPPFGRWDPRSIPAAVLELLASAHVAYVLPEELSIIRTFLSTPYGNEENVWQTFDAYWDAVDFAAREQRVHDLYVRNRH